MKSTLICFIWLFSLVILSVSCARPFTASKEYFILTSTGDILNQLEKRKDDFKDLRAWASLSFQSEDESYSFQEALLLQVPAHIRMEILSPFGNPVVLMVANENNFSIFDMNRKKFYQGRASQENLYRFLQLPLKPEDLINLLSGNIPHLDSDAPVKEVVISNKKVYLLEGSDDHYLGKWRMWIDSQNYVPLRVALFSLDGEVLYDVYYEDFQSVNDYRFPGELTILMPSEGKKLSLKYKTITLNQGIPVDVFQLKVPEGIDVIQMD